MNYRQILENIFANGQSKMPVRHDSDGNIITLENGTIGTFMEVFRHDMSGGEFPLLTSRKMPWKSIRVELEGFIKGITDKQWYIDRNCHYWDQWCNPTLINNHPYISNNKNISKNKYDLLKKQAQEEINDLGPVYGANWSNFNGTYRVRPQILTKLDKTIKVNSNTKCPFGLVGKEINGRHGAYTVVSYDGKDKYHNSRFTVKFHTSGFVKNGLSKQQIEDAGVFDPYFPSTCGVACVGKYKDVIINNVSNEEDKNKIIYALKNQWKQMIHRCYNPNNPSYKNYGGLGVYVDNSWLIFENFLEQVQSISGWNCKLNEWENYHLDKDISRLGYYGPDSCEWTTREENANNTSRQYYFNAIDPNGKKYFNQYGLSRFCKKHGLKTKVVEASITSKTKTHKGWQFYRKNNIKIKPKVKIGVNQIKNIVDKLRSNPYDRRMVCSAWNPAQEHKMALPPCHMMWNVVVYGDKLNLVWHQRSVDVGLGLPSNIASYALLQLLLCKSSGLKPGELVGTLADCHIYENHISSLRELLDREDPPLPRVEIQSHSDCFDIFNWSHDQVDLIDYNPLPKLNIGSVTV